jgi:hypothetical protein
VIGTALIVAVIWWKMRGKSSTAVTKVVSPEAPKAEAESPAVAAEAEKKEEE